MIQKLLEEFAKPFYRLNIGGIEIIPDSKKEFTGVSHRELFSFINDLLNVRACKIKKKQANRVQLQVMPKIADNWLDHKCINNACWFHNVVTKNNCSNEKINDDITGCSPRVEHKQLLNGIVGKKKADKISADSNFTA